MSHPQLPTPSSRLPKKVLIIGSGPIVIGQAAEFDYAGTQACRALREEGVETVLVNSNPATIMTDLGVADSTYIEPLTVDMIEDILRRERPDGVLATLGGQTGLNLAVEAASAGLFDRYGAELIGTRLDSIRTAEDRELFKLMLQRIGEPVPESEVATSVEQALAFADGNGFPVIVRPAFTLGGTGGGQARDRDELQRVATSGLAASPVGQVLVERSLIGWKELEYEVLRDAADTCIVVCNMENVDPMGVHTGDSIVVAPSQTLSDVEYQMLRTAAIKIIRALDIRGGCNVQFALDPRSRRYFVIEVNPRVSRSSALASKATGYPIARVSAKIALGKRLDEIPNAVTRRTTAAFEPSLDYVVVKVPRWPFDKFGAGDRTLGTQMKATGEVMAIDRSFEAALQKAIRSLEFRGRSLLWEEQAWSGPSALSAIWRLVETPNDLRLWAVMAALRREITPAEVAARSGIDRFFVDKLANVVEMERRLLGERLATPLLRAAKRLGFADVQIATLAGELPEHIRERRAAAGLRPVYKMVDTCAAEFEAVTPYFYGTYEIENEAPPLDAPKAAILGSGPIRIGQGIEFDYCSVRAAAALEAAGVRSILVNSNPETVSTDFDASSRLYFEPLDAESVLDILENEQQPPCHPERSEEPRPPVTEQSHPGTGVLRCAQDDTGGEDATGGRSGSGGDETDTRPLIAVNDLWHTYLAGTPLEATALTGADFELHDREIAAIIGHTGSGKSTLVQHLNALLRPRRGSVRVADFDLADPRLDPRRVRRLVGLVFQFPEQQLFEPTVGDDVAFGPRKLGCDRHEVRRRVRDAMEAVGLGFESFKDRYTFGLSGGEMRRVAIAGVLALEPRVLVLDEPTASLDPRGRTDLLATILRLRQERGIAIVFVSHNMEEVAELAERVWVIAAGRTVLHGPVRDVFRRADELRDLGLGVPAVTRLVHALADRGVAVPPDVITLDEAEQAVWTALTS